MNSNDLLNTLNGIYINKFKLLNKLNLFTIKDLLQYVPKRFSKYSKNINYNKLRDSYVQTVCGVITNCLLKNIKYNKKLVLAKIKINDGIVDLLWFNSSYIYKLLYKYKVNRTKIYIRGRVLFFNNYKTIRIIQGEIFTEEKYLEKRNHLEPVYHLTKGITNKFLIKYLNIILDKNYQIEDDNFLSKCYSYIIKNENFKIKYRDIHFPKNSKAFINARTYISFKEIFYFLLILKLNKLKDKKEKSNIKIKDFSIINKIKKFLPYKLTKNQDQIILDIKNDLIGKTNNTRLIQGDVGSGKTVIAFIYLIVMALNNYQSVLMVPTVNLAIQHYKKLKNFLKIMKLNINISLLTSDLTKKEKTEIYKKIKIGDSNIIIGTHSLINEDITYKNLGFVVIDEQHKFGVLHREKLINKGINPYVIVMSATPIPRTVGLILYNDMIISRLIEKPNIRKKIKSYVINKDKIEKVYKFMIKEIVDKKNQAYIVCPLIDYSDDGNGKDVISLFEELNKKYGKKVKFGVFHGKLSSKEKIDIMNKFLKKEIDVLISTTIIEVGLDIKDATIMIIEDADQFGLATLHQLRGRIGRSNKQSFCFFINSKEIDNEKLKKIAETDDGFKIAEFDFEERGPGELSGLDQSGNKIFKVANIYRDKKLLIHTNKVLNKILENNKILKSKDFKILTNNIKNKDKYVNVL